MERMINEKNTTVTTLSVTEQQVNYLQDPKCNMCYLLKCPQQLPRQVYFSWAGSQQRWSPKTPPPGIHAFVQSPSPTLWAEPSDLLLNKQNMAKSDGMSLVRGGYKDPASTVLTLS